MATEVKVPSLGESISEATVAKWHKKVGDAVKVDEPLVELETDKATAEVPSPVSGVLSEIVADVDSEVAIGAVLARISDGAAGAASAPAPEAAPAPSAPAAHAPAPASASTHPGSIPCHPLFANWLRKTT